MLERNRNQVVSKDDINRLETKIKDLEGQITSAKQKGEEKKLDKLEESLRMTKSFFNNSSSKDINEDLLTQEVAVT